VSTSGDTGHDSGRGRGNDSGHDAGCNANHDQDHSRLSPAARAATGLITGYRRFISPFLGPRCRFYPTCSAYAGEAVTRFGIVRGGWLALRRIVRCQPLCEGGIDPVPEEFNWLTRSAGDPE